MDITVTAFGIAKDILGGANTKISVQDEHLKVGDLKNLLNVQFPAFSRLKQYMIAIDQNYASDDQIIHGNEEIVIIPPVSGG